MKRLSSILCLATAAVFMATIVSCQKEQPTAVQEETEQDGKLEVSMLGIAGEYEQSDDAKAVLVSNVRVKWAENDKVYVFDGVKCLGNLYVESIDANGVTAKLKGTVDTPTAGKTKVTLVHTNALTGAPTIESGNVKIDLSNQANAGSSPDNVPFVAYSTINADQLGKSLSVSFKLASSVMRLNCSNLDASANINKAKLTGMGNKVVINVTGTSDATVGGEAGDIALSFNDFKAGTKGTKTIYAAIAKTTADANQVLSLTTTPATQKFEPVGEIPTEILSKIEETRDCVLGKAAINAGLSVNAICLMSDHPYTIIAGKKWSTRFMTTVENGTEYINYYYWAGMRAVILKNGEKAYWADTKEAYDGPTAKSNGYRPYYDVSNSKYTKYLDEDHDTLEDMDDAAVQKWGDGWRMPTSLEILAMAKQTAWVYNVVDDKCYAYIFAAKEGDGAYHQYEGTDWDPDFCNLVGYKWPDSANWEKYKDETPLLVLPCPDYIVWDRTEPTDLSYCMYAWTRSLSNDRFGGWSINDVNFSYEFHIGTNHTYNLQTRGLGYDKSARHALFPILPMHD